jgi:hypothetical protein
MAAAELLRGVETVSGVELLANLRYDWSPFGPSQPSSDQSATATEMPLK